jgi:dihydroorotase
MTDLSITNAKLVLPSGEHGSGGVRCSGDRIEAVGDVETCSDAFDAKGAILAPAIVDLGVFAIDKPAFHFGGIARAALMPDGEMLDAPAPVRFAARSGKPDLWVHPIAAATRALEGAQMTELALMREAGARAVATGRQWIADSGTMLRVLQVCAALDLTCIVTAEDGGLAGDAVATSGPIATRFGLSSAPAEAEALAIARDLMLAEMSGARVHFRHVTTTRGLELLRRAKADGLAVTAGVSPAYFMLSDLAVADFRTFARLSPPLRSEEDRHAVRAAIGDGTIDVVCSSHDPLGGEDKRLPFADAAPGMAGAETLLPLTLSLVRDGVIELGRAFQVLASNPARLLGVKAGQIEQGYEADLVLVDPDRPWIVDSGKMRAAAGNTPFDRQGVEGRATALFKGGKRIA